MAPERTLRHGMAPAVMAAARHGVEQGPRLDGFPTGCALTEARFASLRVRVVRMARRDAVRINVTLDAEHAQRLKRMAEQAYAAEGTLARSLLSRAIDDAEVDGRTMVEILNGIPGTAQRLVQARDELKRGEGIPLDEL